MDRNQFDRAPPLDLLKTLGDNTRYAIYLELSRANRPLTTSEIADTIDLHPNTVRPHLDRMRDVGLIEVQVGGRGEIGRPQHRYSIAAAAPSLGFEPPLMPVLARMILTMADRLGATSDDAYAVGVDEGYDRSVPYGNAASTLEAIVSDLDRLGFDPVVSDPGPGDGRPQIAGRASDAAVVAFAHCPFGELAEQHPDLVCAVHHGLIDGFVRGMGDADASGFCSIASRTPCRVTVSTRLDDTGGAGVVTSVRPFDVRSDATRTPR